MRCGWRSITHKGQAMITGLFVGAGVWAAFGIVSGAAGAGGWGNFFLAVGIAMVGAVAVL